MKPISCKQEMGDTEGTCTQEGPTGFCSVSRFVLNKVNFRTSLVVQWLRIRLPMQGTRVQALVREDPTGHGATKPVRHNY